MIDAYSEDSETEAEPSAEELLIQLDKVLEQLKSVLPPQKLQEQINGLQHDKNQSLNDKLLNQVHFDRQFEFAPVCFVRFNHNGRIIEISRSSVQLLGESLRNIVGKPFARWILPSDIGHFFRHIKKALHSGEKQTDYFNIVGRDRSVFVIRMDTMLGKSDVDEQIECRAVLFDVTDLKKNELKLLDKKRQLQQITAAMTDIVLYIDKDFIIRYTNRSCTPWIPTNNEQIIEKSLEKLIGTECFNAIREQIKNQIEPQAVEQSLSVNTLTGHKLDLRLSLFADRDIDSEIIGYTGIIQDVTQQKNQDMLNGKRLLESAQVARLCNMGEMASEIAHELNQPLASITLYSELLHRRLDQEVVDKQSLLPLLRKITEQSLRAGEITHRIKRFAGKKSTQKDLHSINELVHNTVELLKVESELHHTLIKLELAEKLPKIRVNNILIEQVIVNLMRNAIEAMSETSQNARSLSIFTHLFDGNKICLNISDTGPGLHGDTNKIFDTFFTSKVHGMGMGLAICKSIIDEHQGKIIAENNAQGGATFRIFFPVTNLSFV